MKLSVFSRLTIIVPLCLLLSACGGDGGGDDFSDGDVGRFRFFNADPNVSTIQTSQLVSGELEDDGLATVGFGQATEFRRALSSSALQN